MDFFLFMWTLVQERFDLICIVKETQFLLTYESTFL